MVDVIDDVRLPLNRPKFGHPILFSNQEIREMFQLANLGKKDIFFDLGCGWGQNLIIALTEFKVKKAIGIEDDEKRCKIAISRLEKLSRDQKGIVVNEKFEKLFNDNISGIDLHDATVVFYGLDPMQSVLNGLKRKLRKNCKLITYFNCLFPQIVVNYGKYPFFISKVPFIKTTSEYQWLNSVIQKQESTVSNNVKPSLDELWKEYLHDFDVLGSREVGKQYKKRLKYFLKPKKFQ